ncbi:hypothetical protein U1Q18_045815 [Sarracenia purpurea var. burkii]
MRKGKEAMPQTNAPSSSTGPKSPIKKPSRGTHDHPTSVVVPTQFERADHMDSNVDIPASGHIDISVEKGVGEVPVPPQTTPVQPTPLPSNKKLGSGKKNK